MPYLAVILGSALGGLLRYVLTGLMIPVSSNFPVGTLLINVAGSFVIGFFGTLTLHGGKYAASENVRLFVMVGICGGFTTFSSFSLQTFDLLRAGNLGRAMANVLLSVVLCLVAVSVGHLIAYRVIGDTMIAQSNEEDLGG